MQVHTVQRTHPNKKPKRVGRGGKRGTYSGRGIKGQKARAGTRLRPELRDIIKKIHKRRGYGKNRSRTVNDSARSAIPVSIALLEKVFENGATVSPRTLHAHGVIRKSDVHTPIKILGTGALSKKLTISGCAISASAQKVIEEAGGAVEPKAVKIAA